MRSRRIFSGVIFVMMTLGTCLGAATAQNTHAAAQPANAKAQSSTLSAETKLFLAQWQPLQQKGLSEAEADALYAELSERYGIISIPDETTKSQTLMLPVWLTFASAEAAEPALRAAQDLGFKVQTRLKTICTGLVPVEHLEALSQIEGVRQVQVNSRAKLHLDLMRKATQLDSVQNFNINPFPQWPSIRGEGVVVGIVDCGIEYVHPNFYQPNQADELRIKRVWAQRESRGTPPEGYEYGSEFKTPDEIKQAAYSRDGETHGTHVTGIAAGSGAGTAFVGAASKADLVIVPTNLEDEGILDGIQYIHRYAKAEGKPCVVNLSLGQHVGPHDGTSVFDRAMDEMKEPGFVVVGAAGNEGRSQLYIGRDFTPNDTVFYTQVKFDPDTKNTYIDLWSRDSLPLSVNIGFIRRADGMVIDSTGFRSMDDTASYNKTLQAASDKLVVKMMTEKNEFNGKYRLLLYADARNFTMGGGAEHLVCMTVKTNQPHRAAHVDIWSNTGDFTRFQHPTLPSKLIIAGTSSCTAGEIGGTGKSILSVGSFTTRNVWQSISGITVPINQELTLDTLSYFSSHGPTADGRIKPDITAPGAYIVSSINSHFPFNKLDQVTTVNREEADYPFGVMMGTSMAAPAVTGMVALCLQLRPDWQVDSLRYYLSHTATNDRYTGNARQKPNNDWGYGKINILSLLGAALNGITDVSSEELQEAIEGRRLLIYPNPNSGRFYTLLPNEGREVRLQVLDHAGRVVCERRAYADGSPLEWSLQNLSKGFYVVRMEAISAARETAASAASTSTTTAHTAKFIIQ